MFFQSRFYIIKLENCTYNCYKSPGLKGNDSNMKNQVRLKLILKLRMLLSKMPPDLASDSDNLRHFPKVIINVRILGVLLEFYAGLVVLNGTDRRQICCDQILIEI